MSGSHSQGASEAKSDLETPQLSMELLWRALRIHWQSIAVWGAAASLIAGIVGTLQPREYTASAIFVPQAQAESPQSGLRALAGQFGLNVGGAAAAQSPDLYVETMLSLPFLKRVVSEPLVVDLVTPYSTLELAVLFAVDDQQEPGARLEEAALALRDRTSLTVSRKSGAIMLSVATSRRDASIALVSKLIAEVNRFNIETRRSQASAERSFAEARLDSSRAELRAVEDLLSRFLERNRQFASSPQLAFEKDRLEREVAVRQQLVLTLTQALEEARLREVRDTPLISVISAPDASHAPDSRYILLMIVLGFAAGAGLRVFFALVRLPRGPQRV